MLLLVVALDLLTQTNKLKKHIKCSLIQEDT